MYMYLTRLDGVIDTNRRTEEPTGDFTGIILGIFLGVHFKGLFNGGRPPHTAGNKINDYNISANLLCS